MGHKWGFVQRLQCQRSYNNNDRPNTAPIGFALTSTSFKDLQIGEGLYIALLSAAEADFLSSAINLSECFFRLGTEGRYSVTNSKRFLLVVCFYCSTDISNVLI